MTHLSDDETVAKMGHPIVVVRSDVGHPSKNGASIREAAPPIVVVRSDVGHPRGTRYLVCANELRDLVSACLFVSDGDLRALVQIEFEATHNAIRGFDSCIFRNLIGLGLAYLVLDDQAVVMGLDNSSGTYGQRSFSELP